MGFRAYVLLDVVDGESQQVVQALRGQPGVFIADPLEGPPDVIMVVEASERQELAKLTIRALDLVEAMVRNTVLLPSQD